MNNNSRIMVFMLWFFGIATPAMAHGPPYVEPYKYVISFVVSAYIGASIGIPLGKKNRGLGIIVGLLIFAVCALVGVFASVYFSL